MTLPIAACIYVVNALDNTSATLTALLSGLSADSRSWDERADPDRFSPREIVAHLADWEVVWQERFERTLNEDMPHLPRPDLDRRAEEKGYADADPIECLTRFKEKRAALTDRLRSLPEDAWNRVAHLDRIGDVPLSGLAALALGHDSYHVRQVSERDAQEG